MSTVRHPAIRIAFFALAFRLASAVLAFLENVVFPLNQPQTFTMLGQTSPFWDTFTRYDSGWYFQVARNGYEFVVGGPAVGLGKVGKIAYFPLYPMLMRWVGRLFGQTAADVYRGGIVVSWVAFVLAMIGLYYLARLDVPARRAERAVVLATVFPFAFFFGVVYTESLFLLLTVATFYAFRTRHWIWGGLAGALATATRVNGLLMLPALAWIVWRQVGPDRRERVLAVTGLALVPVGIGLYSWYVYTLTGNPLEWAASIQRWGYYPGGAPWLAPFRLLTSLVTHPYAFLAGERMAPYDTLNGVAALSFALTAPFVWWRLGAAYGMFMLANLWLPLSSGQFEGLGRYCSVLFPCFIWLASLRSRFAATWLVVVFAMLYSLCLALFTTIHPLF
jgi:hypothetical protein